MALKRRIVDLETGAPLSVLTTDINGENIFIPQSELISGDTIDLVLEASTLEDQDISINRVQGVLDGVNRVFIVPEASYISGQIKVFIEDIELTLDQQYEETDPTIGSITLAQAPKEGTNVLIRYNSIGVLPNPAVPVIINLGSEATGSLNFNPVRLVFQQTINVGELTNINQQLSGVSLLITVSGAFPYGGADAGDISTTGVNFGATTFDDTLENNLIYNTAVYSSNTRDIEYEFSGFQPNELIDFRICGARTTNGGARQTLVTSNDNKTATILVDNNPPESPKDIIGIVANNLGVITLTQSSIGTDPNYLNGIQFSI